LGSACSFLVADQLIEANDTDALIAVARLDPVRPRFRKIDTVYGCDDINPVGGKAHLEKMRNSAPAPFNAANRSLKSGFTLIGVNPRKVFEGEIPQGFHAGLWRRFGI